MNKLHLVATMALTSSLIAAPVLAEKRERIQEAKNGITFAATTILGGIAGGPVGFMLGALGGAYLGEQGKNAVERQIHLEEQKMTLSQLEEQVSEQDLEITKLEHMLEKKMQFQMYFKTGEDMLSEEDAKQIDVISDFMIENNHMEVSVEGFADPRGSDEYNNVLSRERAASVAKILSENGVPGYRIHTQGYGSNFSSGLTGELDDYAKERKVRIQIFNANERKGLAVND